MNAPELVTQLAKAFDPEVQQTRDDERSQRSFQAMQFHNLSQQLRDAQAATENLRNQLDIVRNHSHEVERTRDLAEFKLQMMQRNSGLAPNPKRQSRQEWLAEHHPDIVRIGGKVRSERIYADGGRCTEWHSDLSDDEKENWAPFGSSSSSSLAHPSSSSSHALPSSSSPAPSSDIPVAGPSSAARFSTGDAI